MPKHALLNWYKHEPFLNIDDEEWYQRVDYFLDDLFVFSVLNNLRIGEVQWQE